MTTTLGCLFNYWPGMFGLTFQDLINDPYCNWVLGCCGNFGAEKKLCLDRCVGHQYRGHLLQRSDDTYYWVKL